MTTALVAAWIGSTNLGDELVLAALRAKLEARGVHALVASLDPAATADRHDVEAFGHLDPRGWAKALSAADVMVFGGGGLLQDETGPFNLPYHLARPLAMRVARRPVAWIGVGAGRLDTRVGRSLVRHSLKGQSLVSVRDAASAALLRELGIDARLAADLVFSFAPTVTTARDDLIVCLRPWTSSRSPATTARRRAAAATPEWFLQGVADALDAASDRLGLSVRFVALQADRDDAVHRSVADRMRTTATTATPDLNRVRDQIGSGRLVVAMRYHAAVCAALAGRPTALISYSPKVAALADDLGPGAQHLGWDIPSLQRLPHALEALAQPSVEQRMIEAAARLHERESVNDVVLDQLLSSARRSSRRTRRSAPPRSPLTG